MVVRLQMSTIACEPAIRHIISLTLFVCLLGRRRRLAFGLGTHGLLGVFRLPLQLSVQLLFELFSDALLPLQE